MIGSNAITFLGLDKKVLASHPTAFLETYTVDLHNSKMLTYAIKQVHFLKKDDIMTFSFVAHSEEVARKLVRRLDRFVLASFRKVKKKEGNFWGGLFVMCVRCVGVRCVRCDFWCF